MLNALNKIFEDAGRNSKKFNFLFSCLALIYTYFFYRSISEYWFDPEWTTDDALQQVFPFHSVYHPGIFDNDLPTKMMKSYLAPLHYWLWWGTTWVTADPLMAGHWLTLLQFGLTAGFLFFAVKRAAGTAPACFSFIWLLHTRHIMQRMTGGLPRGWSACVFAAFLYFVLQNRHRSILALLLLGCLLNPPGTLVIAGAYGLYLLWGFADPKTRPQCRRPLVALVALSPLYILTVLSVTRMPAEIGSISSYAQAMTMPEYNAGGRFPFVPFESAWTEIRKFGFQTFLNRWFHPARELRNAVPWFVIGVLSILAGAAIKLRRTLVPRALWCFIISAATVYFLSRAFAFHLYVPNRHLQIPFAIFIISAFSIGVWKLVDVGPRGPAKASAALIALAMIVALTSGPGVAFDRDGYGQLNFNTGPEPSRKVWRWIKANTSENALIAGEPTHIDKVQLFGMRRGYITTETAHPFFDSYYNAIKGRLEISLRAHYARTLQELVELCEPQGITHFVFERRRFYPEELASASYHKPYDSLVKALTARDPMDFAYRQIPRTGEVPYLVYRDELSVVVDVAKLKEFLNSKTKNE